MSNPVTRIVTLMVIVFVLAACGGAAAEPTAVPATNTPAPTSTPRPTATPMPTETPVPVASAPEAIRAGLASAAEITTYRVELSLLVSGNLGEGMPAAPAGQPMEMIGMRGEVEGENSRLTLSGLLAAFLGADPEKGTEFVTVDGKTYLRGPVALLGATDDGWYELPADQESPTSSFSSGQITDSFSGADVDLSGFTIGGVEELDGLQCTVFVGDKETTVALFERIGEEGVTSPIPIAEVDTAETRFYICEDGRFHKMTIDMSGTPEGQTEAVSFGLLLRLYDFDADISVSAPENAQPLPQVTTP